MEKEKQIEEMAKVLCSLIKDGIRKDCEKCYFKHDGYRHTCKFRKRAIKLYKAGYGNVKEAVKEFAEGLIKNGVYSCKCSTLKEVEVAENLVEQFENHIKEYAKEYGVEVEE